MVETNYIPPSKLDSKRITGNGNTQDIIESVLRMDKRQEQDFCKFAQQFAGGEEGLKKLWRFVRYDIAYKKDGHQQIIKAPAALWRLRHGDCKSKTLFINAVLKCLNIPYLVRFTNYSRNDHDVKHVYTVALLDGKEIPIDSVYHTYGKEEPYFKKLDYMAEIIEITGIGAKLQEQHTSSQVVSYSPNNCNQIYAGENVAHLIELRQKKEYIKPQAPIQFNKITEGQAALEIVKRELQILSVMQEDKAKLAEVGINLINKALKGNYFLSGNIPPELGNLCKKIQIAEGLKMPANSFSPIRNSKILKALNEAQGDQLRCHSLGLAPERKCLNDLWYIKQFNSQTQNFIPGQYSGNLSYNNTNGFCAIKDLIQFSQQQFFAPGISPGTNIQLTNGQALTWYYGRNSQYAKTFNEVGADLLAALRSLEGTLLHGLDGTYNGQRSGQFSAWFNTEQDYKGALEILNAQAGVLESWVNDIYRADSTAINGTMGSGLFYHFADNTKYQGQQISPNALPGVVLTKQGFQNQFIDSCNIFSGVSKSNLAGMARNGVLFDSGKQPEETLDRIYSIYKTGNSSGIAGATIGEPISATIAAIATAVIAIVGAVAAAVAEGKKAEQQAENIDTSLADSARFQPLTISTMPAETDYLPTTGAGAGGGAPGGTGAGESNNLPLILGAGAAAYFMLNRNKKDETK